MSEHTPRPWYVRDFRESYMRELGWVGPSIDRILITNKTGAEIEASAGADCVVARIQFDNRAEQLGDGNLADACLIAAAPDLLAAVRSLLCIDFERFTEHDELLLTTALSEAKSALAKAAPPTLAERERK